MKFNWPHRSFWDNLFDGIALLSFTGLALYYIFNTWGIFIGFIICLAVIGLGIVLHLLSQYSWFFLCETHAVLIFRIVIILLCVFNTSVAYAMEGDPSFIAINEELKDLVSYWQDQVDTYKEELARPDHELQEPRADLEQGLIETEQARKDSISKLLLHKVNNSGFSNPSSSSASSSSSDPSSSVIKREISDVTEVSKNKEIKR